MADLIHEELEARGIEFTVHVVQSRAQLEGALIEETFDLALCDCDIPQYDPFTAMVQIQRRQPEVPVIFISGSMGTELASTCILKGASEFVSKHRFETLVPTVQRVLRQSALRRQGREAAAAAPEKKRGLRLPVAQREAKAA